MHFFEIFEYGGMHLQTDCFKLGASPTCNLKVLSRWNISYVSMITCGYRNSSSILPLQVLDTRFWAMVLLRHIYKLRC